MKKEYLERVYSESSQRSQQNLQKELFGRLPSEDASSSRKNMNPSRQFLCSCGKKYTSKPAVYTHIKNKHDNNRDKFKIIDASNGKMQVKQSIRVENMKYPRKEATLMTIADLTFVEIFKAIKQMGLDINKYILDDSDSQQEKQRTKNYQISFKAEQHLRKHDLLDLYKALQDNVLPKLQFFTVHRFQLSIITEICKFFKDFFAWRIQQQILLCLIKQIDNNQRINECEGDLWKEFNKKIQMEVQAYCKSWQEARNMNIPKLQKHKKNRKQK